MIFLQYSDTALKANCYILADDTERQAIVVDPGAGCVDWVNEALATRNLTLAAILLTHAHADHCWDAGVIAGDEVPVYVADADMYRLDDPARHTGFVADPFVAESGHTWVRPTKVESLPPLLLVGGGAQLVPGVALRALPAPGHTEGSTVYLFGGTLTEDAESPVVPEGADEGQYILTGDLLFEGSVGRTDLPGGDVREMIESLRTVTQVIAPGTAFFAGHGGSSTIGFELENNPYVRQAIWGA